jgi:lysophospholipase L1-like esterase
MAVAPHDIRSGDTTQGRDIRLGLRIVRRGLVLALAAAAAACGGTSPTGPYVPTPTPAVPTFPVTLVVFEDWNNDGVRTGVERLLGGVQVSVAGVGGVTDGAGRVSLMIPGGNYLPAIGTSGLPPFLTTVRDVLVSAPQSAVQELPLAYPIGGNRVGVYMAFGDSISSGDLSSDLTGYRSRLGRKLSSFYGQQIGIEYRGGSGGRTSVGADRVEADVRDVRPAYTLILWGVNDYAGGLCNPSTCDAIPNLRFIIREVKRANSLPVIGTLTPSYTGYDSRAPPDRNDWVRDMNGRIKTLAAEEGALLADIYAAFDRNGGYTRLIGDHIHPNDAGYEVMAETWFQAITSPRGAGALKVGRPMLLLDLFDLR